MKGNSAVWGAPPAWCRACTYRHGGRSRGLSAARTAFVSQKCALDYCRARAGIGWAQLCREDEFGRAIERCRWDSYAAVLADVGEVALIYLRHCGGEGRAGLPATGRAPSPA